MHPARTHRAPATPPARRFTALALLLLGGLGEAGALTLLFMARTAPGEGFQDLGRIVGAMMLVGLSAIPLALSVWLARPASRITLALVALACAFALVPGVAIMSAGSLGGYVVGSLAITAGLLGLAGVGRRWRG